jgi:hypothetical protein
MYAEKRKHPAVQNADGRERKIMPRQVFVKQKRKKRKERTSRAKKQEPSGRVRDVILLIDSRRAGQAEAKRYQEVESKLD